MSMFRSRKQKKLPSPPPTPPTSPPPVTFFRPTHIAPHTSSDNSVDSFSYSTEGVNALTQYGFLRATGNNVTLGILDVAALLSLTARELEERALATPMLFSNQALQANHTRTKTLIQSFLDTLAPTGKPNHTKLQAFSNDLRLAKEYELAWLLRWALSRISRVDMTGELCRGVVEWETYQEWRGRERAASYPQDAFPFLTTLLPSTPSEDVYTLILTPLFRLLSRFAAHSHLSGLTPHALASLFAPLLFHVPLDQGAEEGHRVFVRVAYATEHLLLAFIRFTEAGTGVGALPSRLKEWITGYPSMLPSDGQLARADPRRGARVVRVERLSRYVRAYTRDLLQHVEAWPSEMDDQGNWQVWDRVLWKSKKGEGRRPQLTAGWKRRLAVNSLKLPLSLSAQRQNAPTTYGQAKRSSSVMSNMSSFEFGGGAGGAWARDEDDGARYGSLAGKEWSIFEEGGFDSLSPSMKNTSSSRRRQTPPHDMTARLQFDLHESTRLALKSSPARRRTMDWSEFASPGPGGGFSKTDQALDVCLELSQPVRDGIQGWEAEKGILVGRLVKMQKAEKVPFAYDTRPVVGALTGSRAGDGDGGCVMEEAYIDVWADLGMGCGWVERNGAWIDANWVFVEYKCRPTSASTIVSSRDDPRTSSVWILYEEQVPSSYREALREQEEKVAAAAGRRGFGLFSPRSGKKRQAGDHHSDSYSGASTGAGARKGGGEGDFERMLQKAGTRKVSASTSRQDYSNNAVWAQQASSFAPYPSPALSTPTSPPNATGLRPPFGRSPIKEGGGRTRGDYEDGMKGNFFSSEKGHLGEEADGEADGDGDSPPSTLKSPLKSTNIGTGTAGTAGAGTSRKPRGRQGQKEVDVEYEVESVSGVGVDDGVGVPGGLKGEEKWMDILVVSAQRVPGQDAPAPITPTPKGRAAATTTVESPSLSRPVRLTALGSESGSKGDGMAQAYPMSFSRSPPRAQSPPPFQFEPRPQPRTEPRPQTHQEEVTLHAPTPRRERDTIHGIVSHYSSPSPQSPSRGRSHTDGRGSGESARSMSGQFDDGDDGVGGYANGDGDEYGVRIGIEDAEEEEELQLPPVEQIFDLTPGREPSPARYKHGEPLNFVGEEPEEEDRYAPLRQTSEIE